MGQGNLVVARLPADRAGYFKLNEPALNFSTESSLWVFGQRFSGASFPAGFDHRVNARKFFLSRRKIK